MSVAKRRVRDTADDLSLPEIRSCPKSAEERARDHAAIERWCDAIIEIWRGLDFQVGTREWCYLLEPHGLAKEDFDKAEKRLVKYRKEGFLPLNIVIADDARAASGLEDIDDTTPREEAARVASYVESAHLHYHPISFWENQETYIEMAVEKASLRSLFESECEPYHLPIFNTKGSWDLLSRAALLRRFAGWQAKGHRCVLLYCGDFDPGGLLISDVLRSNLEEMLPALALEDVCVDLDEVTIERFGLNEDFIRREDLPWIEGLSTGGTNTPNLEDPRHPHHKRQYVQDWLRTIGPRKVEASALVRRPEAARALCRRAILRYVDQSRVADFEAEEAEQQALVRMEILGLLGGLSP